MSRADTIREMAAKLKAKVDDLGTREDRDGRMMAHDLGLRRIALLVEAETLEVQEEQTAELKRIADALEKLLQPKPLGYGRPMSPAPGDPVEAIGP